MPDPGELTREELLVLVAAQAGQLATQAGEIVSLRAANAELAARLARVERLLSRNSGNSSMPPSKDGEPGKTPPEKPDRKRRDHREGPKRGKQPGAGGANLAWRAAPDAHEDRFPEGRCECGAEPAGATDLGVTDSFQQTEIPMVSATTTQYDQHAVRCGCGRAHTATRPPGAGAGRVGYGPNLRAWCVYLMVVHALPVHRVAALLESLTGAAPKLSAT